MTGRVVARLRARHAAVDRQLRAVAAGWAEVALVALAAAGPSTRARTVLVLGAGVAS